MIKTIVGLVVVMPLVFAQPTIVGVDKELVSKDHPTIKPLEIKKKEIPEDFIKESEPEPKPEPKKAVQPEPKVLTVKATAYTAYCEGCSGVTYTGQDLRANPNQKVIAVDPNVIPLGSKVYVEGYGEALAGDIGGAIKGHRIDVFIPSHSEAMKWGVKNIEVKILELPE